MRDAAGQGPERFELLRMEQLLLELALAILRDPKLGDILNRTGKSDRLARVVQDELDFPVDITQVAVRPDDPVFDRIGLHSRLDPVQPRQNVGTVVRMDEGEEVFRGRHELVARHPEDPKRLVRPFDRVAAQISSIAAHTPDPLGAGQVLAAGTQLRLNVLERRDVDAQPGGPAAARAPLGDE